MKKYNFPLSIIGLYILVRFIFSSQLDSLGTYASYIFEAAFFIGVTFIYRKRFKPRLTWSPIYLIQLGLTLGLGYVTYTFAVSRFGLVIPFDLNNRETLLFLLLIGPIIEEGVFRQALWWPLEDLLKTPLAVMLVTATLFSFGHFYAYFFVPDLIKDFIVYQTIYTFVLGIWWGCVRAKSQTALSTLPLHCLFNFGFYLGSQYSIASM